MEQEIFIYAHWSKYSKEVQYTIADYEKSDDYVLLERRNLNFESPTEKELKVRCAAVLRENLNKMRGEHFLREKEAEEVIQELLALEDYSAD